MKQHRRSAVAWGLASMFAGALMAEGGVREVIAYWPQGETSTVVVGAIGAVVSLVLLASGVAFCMGRAFARQAAIAGAIGMAPIHLLGWVLGLVGVPGVLLGVAYPTLLLLVLRAKPNLGAPAHGDVGSTRREPLPPSDHMKRRAALSAVPLLVIAFVSPVTTLAQGAAKTAANPAPNPAESRLAVMPAGDMKWADLDPGAPGVKVADLWGHHAKGAFGALFKLPAGFAAPLHTHTHDMKVVIVSGTYIQAPEGKPEFRLGPGSYFMQPGGNYRHTTTCDKASDCVFFVESRGPFDLKPVPLEKGPTK
jgi:uncharacterized protein DUF4437